MADVQDRDAMAAQRRAEEAQCLIMNERMMTPSDRASRELAKIKSEGGSPEMAVYRKRLLDVATKQANASREEFIALAAAADAAGRDTVQIPRDLQKLEPYCAMVRALALVPAAKKRLADLYAQNEAFAAWKEKELKPRQDLQEDRGHEIAGLQTVGASFACHRGEALQMAYQYPLIAPNPDELEAAK